MGSILIVACTPRTGLYYFMIWTVHINPQIGLYLWAVSSWSHSTSKIPCLLLESQLLAICMDLFMAGSETTTKSLGFCFLYLLLYPDVQRRAQSEIDAVVGRGRLPTLNDRPKWVPLSYCVTHLKTCCLWTLLLGWNKCTCFRMPYMEAIVLESVRMFMGRTFSIPHRALRDTELQGYHIPKVSSKLFKGIMQVKMLKTR